MNTAQDIVAYLIASNGGGSQDGEHAAIRQAVLHGVRDVMQCRQWLWHVRAGSFTTQGITTTGSVTTGSKDVVVASTAGFVPGRMVQIGAEYFPKTTRIMSINGNVVTLDVASTRTATGVPVQPQVYYDLPADLKDIDTLVTNTVGTLHTYLTPQEWQRLEINTRGAGEPYYYTVMRSDIQPDRYQIRFVGVPTNTTVVHYTYRVNPPPIKYMGYERLVRQGTVAVALDPGTNTPVVTGTGTAFPQDCAGCYIRFGADGMDADPVGATVPFVMERRIEKWNSKTELLISSSTIYNRPGPYGIPSPDEYDGGVVGTPVANPTVPYSSEIATLPTKSKYSITDVIDASPQMYTAILSACEMWYARMAGKQADTALAMFNRDLRLAMEADVVAPYSGRPGSTPYPTPRSMGWHSELMPDLT
jgi:hypothetical protein